MVTDEFIQDFVDEAKAHIEKAESAFLDTENFVKNDETINTVFRAIHSIKGTAGFFQLQTIVSLSHAMENVLGQIRAKKLAFTEAVLDCLLHCNDQLKSMIFNVETSDEVDINDNLKQLENLLSNPPQPQAPPTPQTQSLEATPTQSQSQSQSQSPSQSSSSLLSPSSSQSVSEKILSASENHPEASQQENKASKNKKLMDSSQEDIGSLHPIDEKWIEPLRKLTKKGHHIYKVVILYNENLTEYYKNIHKFFDSLKEIGEIIDVFSDGTRSHDMNDIARLCEKADENSTVRIEILATSVLEYELFYASMLLPASWVTLIKFDQISKKEESHTNSAKPDESIRVNIRLLENLMALSGEMVLARNQLLTAYNAKNTEPATMTRILQNIDQLTSRLQAEIMLTRMQPVGTIFNKFPRVIRDISKSINKDIVLNIAGKEIELDKTMIEGLSDPIIHLVRNAADHGIEPGAEREKVGKQKQGTITLKASHQSGLVAIEISDDGAGINVNAVKKKAIEKDLISAAQAEAMTDAEVYKLIFLPGFSTAKVVSDISGRGVGMDVVRSNVEKMGGTVEITSVAGGGTTITLLLPRTLAIMHSLVVGTAGQRFAIPQSSITQVVSLKEEEIQTKLANIHRAKEYRLRGKLLPVVSLAEILGIQNASESTAQSGHPTKIVVITVLKKQLGLLVHEVYDAEETLVKPLPFYLKSCFVYSGVTIMGDGFISLILDPEGIVKKSGINFSDKEEKKQLTAVEKETIMQEYQSMLLFKCSGPETYALDMNMVSRVETIKAEDIEEVGTEKYVKIRGKTLRVIRPETYLPVHDLPYDSEKLTVIIPNLVRHPMGILVKSMIDNTKAHFVLDTEQIKSPGIFGTILYQNRIVLILNLYELFEIADPKNHSPTKEEKIDKRILIVEDTPFFRHIEQKYLEDAGCRVSVAENGSDALKLLEEGTFDVIVSDLIMPVMGGLEFIKQVRKNPKYENIAAVAVSSMTGDNYVDKALEYGFDAYENKLDKESLLRTINRIYKSKGGAGI